MMIMHQLMRTHVLIGPIKNKLESATFQTAEAFIRKTSAESCAKAYEAVDAQVTAAIEQFQQKKAELQAKAQAKKVCISSAQLKQHSHNDGRAFKIHALAQMRLPVAKLLSSRYVRACVGFCFVAVPWQFAIGWKQRELS